MAQAAKPSRPLLTGDVPDRLPDPRACASAQALQSVNRAGAKPSAFDGGGLAGLSTGCYGRVNGWRTTIVEHNLALGGVCTAWRREPYTVDGCIHWLTGGPFMKIYNELGDSLF